ncbi:MAG: Glu-tRNA(Gln) amidotransferase GatDE subunit D [Thermoprotei archaeon]|nr:MAG: Glu-tRNA(Gln) amidotransferase GatDE subunit D [Thermoprotei archaeon]
MSFNEYGSYSDDVKKLLKGIDARVFDKVRVHLKSGQVLEGLVLPRPEYGSLDCLVIKLDNGYNVGIHINNIERIELVAKGVEAVIKYPPPPSKVAELPKVAVLGTGGTILSKVDYVSGAVYPTFSAEDIYGMVPELQDLANLDIEMVFSIFSEDMTPQHWEKLAQVIERKFRNGCRGIVVFHGTDTMGYSAAAMAFAVRNAPGPVVFVGAQRSSDRPSTDAVMNVICAVTVAVKAPFAESVVCMHGESGDTYALVHRGVRVRKMHTSRRDAFRSINDIPLAKVEGSEIVVINRKYIPRSKSIDDMICMPKFDNKTVLLKFYPGMQPDIIDYLVDKGYHGIVLEGTGLGHVGQQLLKSIRRAIEMGIPVVMTSQCLYGRINMNVYRRGVELLKMGVIPGHDMLPETAYVKLSWVLAQTRDLDEVRKLMTAPIVYEINPTTSYVTYPQVYQEVTM